MSWVSIKCPYCGDIAKVMTVNPSARYRSVLNTTCGICHKQIRIETNKDDVIVYEND